MTLPSDDHPIFLPSKLWAANRAAELQESLEGSGYESAEARRLAEALAAVLDSVSYDEERNYNAIEQWLPPGIHVGDTAPADPETFMAHDRGNADAWIDTSTINDQPATLDELTPVGSTVMGGSAVELPDGRVIYVWADADGTNIRQGYADSTSTFTSSSGSVTEDRILFSNLTLADLSSGHGRCAVAWSDSRLRLTTSWLSQAGDNIAKGRVYESADSGASWSLVSEWLTHSFPADWTATTNRTPVGPVRVLDDGSWALVGMRLNENSAGKNIEMVPSVYRRAGGTWSRTLDMTYGYGYTRGLGGGDGDLYVTWYNNGTSTCVIYRSTDRGASWLEVNSVTITGMYRPSVHVAPYASGPDGYQATAVDHEARVQRYLIPDLTQPVSEWTPIGDMQDWSHVGLSDRQDLLQDVGGTLILNVRGSIGTTVIIGTGNAELNLWTGPGAEQGWKPVASLRMVAHDHDDYSLTDHLHDDRYVELSTGENPQVMTNRLYIDASDFGSPLVLEQSDGSMLVFSSGGEDGSFDIESRDSTGTLLSQLRFDAFNDLLGLSNNGYYFQMQSGGLATLDVDIVGIGLYPANMGSFGADTDLAFFRAHPQIETVNTSMATGSAGRRRWIRHGPDGIFFLIDDNDDGAWNTPHPMYIDNAGDVTVGRNFSVGGSKNARISDPADPSMAYQFAATESDRPGVLEHEAFVNQGTVYSMPEHWRRIATNLRVHLTPQDSQAGNAWPEIDHDAWTVAVRGQPGRYLMLARADRADAGVSGWKHVVDVPPSEAV